VLWDFIRCIQKSRFVNWLKRGEDILLEQGTFAGLANWLESEEIIPKSGRKLTLRYHLVQTRSELDEMGELLCDIKDISHDTETSGLNVHLGAKAIGHAFAAQTDEAELSAWYIPIRHSATSEYQLPVEDVADVVKAVLQSSGRAGYHHEKFDRIISRVDGIDITRETHDVSILATINDENERWFGLKPLAAKYIIDTARGEERELEEWMKADARKLKMKYKQRKRSELEEIDELGELTYLERFGYSRSPIHLCGKYACKDVIYTLYLWLITFRHVPKQFSLVYERERKISRILHEMEWTGLPIDEAAVRDAHEKTGERLLHWLGECRRLSGDESFTATDAQIRNLLYDWLRLVPPKWTKGGKGGEKKHSVDKEARELLKRQYPEHIAILEAISKVAEIAKVHTTYAGNFLRYYDKKTGRIYPNYNQLEQRGEGGVPVTGRLASQNPNIQNISRDTLKLDD
jgi:DNA polymerase I-like protein with 3'-5' exonuclease and polymerase domains